jgi:hypothetical protein
MGLELLDTARAVAEFDLPMRVLGVVGNSVMTPGSGTCPARLRLAIAG